MKTDCELSCTLAEVEPPADLDALVLDRALRALDDARPRAPLPLRVPAAEALIYAAGIAAYLAHGAQAALRILARVFAY